MYMTIKYLE